MKTQRQIQEKINEVRLYENECELMAECIATNQHPSEITYEWKTFHDLDEAFKLSPETWEDKSVIYFRIAEALEWVIKD